MYIIIPARYASSRLPGKPLLDIAGKTLIERVYDCARASGAERVIVATDDGRISAAVEAFGGTVCMTSRAHASGTDRIAEVIAQLNIESDTVVVNLQGDEPLMPPDLIRQVAETLLANPDAAMATACHPIHDHASLTNPDIAKVVRDARGHALYFSRAPIPWPRERMAGRAPGSINAYRHIGIYAYRAGFVTRYAAWPPCPLEQTELLEQLRALWHGERIAVCEAASLPGAGVDTPADLERVQKYFSASDRRR
jgi:3-deoxy-manno-octulosonate cytidylyltransferase (CMP-KDO synthetase)